MVSLLKMYFGLTIGRRMIAAEKYSCADQYIADGCDLCQMNEIPGTIAGEHNG